MSLEFLHFSVCFFGQFLLPYGCNLQAMKYLYKILCICFFVSLLSSFGSLKAFALTGPVDPYSFSAAPGKNPGTVTINWYDDKTAQQYNLLYGTDPSHYSFGAV